MIVILFGIFSGSVYCQVDQRRQQIERTRQELRDRQKQNDEFNRLKNTQTSETFTISIELSDEAKQLIAPTEADKFKYRDFLRLPDSDIAKVFNTQCFEIGDVELSDNCKAGIPGYGSHYSFRHQRHFYASYSDLQLYDNWFVCAGFLTQGIIVSLGEIELDNISLQSSGVKFLADLIPAENPRQADEQAAKIENGIQDGDYIYNRAAKVEKNTAYAMRTIAYRSNLKTSIPDKREDTIVVFKVINLDENGNVTFIWRELQSKKSPKLKINQE